MAKLINKLFPKDDYDNYFEDECDIITTYDPVVDNETGEVIAILEISSCEDCGEEWVTQIFTNGDEYLEIFARDLGFRDEYEECWGEDFLN